MRDKPILDLASSTNRLLRRRLLITRALLGKSVRGGSWFTSLDLKDSPFSQEISLFHLHEHGVCLTVTAIHLLFGSMHLLIVCGGCDGSTQASRDKDIILYLNDLLVLSHSEEEM